MRHFFDDITSISEGDNASFQEAYLQSLVLQKALTRMVPIPGDLHGRFHMLDAIYRIFYGCFLQPIQTMLGWKKLNGTDVIQTYDQCHRLADLVYVEVSRVLWDYFICNFFGEEDNQKLLKDVAAEELAVVA